MVALQYTQYSGRVVLSETQVELIEEAGGKFSDTIKQIQYWTNDKIDTILKIKLGELLIFLTS